MIIGEGGIFLLLLLIGIWRIRKAIKKDLKLSERQKNFLLSVTHELKTPLAANKLYIQTVTKRELSKDQSNELLQKAIDENMRLERMIDNILNASRLENNALTPSKEHFSIHKLMQNLADRFQTISGASNIQLDADKDLMLYADHFMTESILNNLVENAIKYAGRENNITLYAYKEGETTVFGVKDEGPGIPKEVKPEVFKKFFRAENEDTRSQKGSGLGLFIVAQLVRIQQGSVECLDNTPKGTNFQITL